VLLRQGVVALYWYQVQLFKIQQFKNAKFYFFIQIWYYGVQLGQIPYNSFFVKKFLVKGLFRFEDCKSPHRVDLIKMLNPPQSPHGVDLVKIVNPPLGWI
jgi:hypothetical protein